MANQYVRIPGTFLLMSLLFIVQDEGFIAVYSDGTADNVPDMI